MKYEYKEETYKRLIRIFDDNNIDFFKWHNNCEIFVYSNNYEKLLLILEHFGFPIYSNLSITKLNNIIIQIIHEKKLFEIKKKLNQK